MGYGSLAPRMCHAHDRSHRRFGARPGFVGAERWRSDVTRVRVPDPPSLPCEQQSWVNADRACLAWTGPRADVPVHNAIDIEGRGGRSHPIDRTSGSRGKPFMDE